jgi:cellulose synthase/poly-beta-1,6-N-acetylglucosamine synthase-like glycosyltransferase
MVAASCWPADTIGSCRAVMSPVALLFWGFVGLLGYVYFLYPLIVRALAALFGRSVARRSDVRPSVTVVITAYNEEKSIAAKIGNVLSLDYPPELLDVIVMSDASSDRTDEIVRQYGMDRVRLIRVEGRVGKTSCQNRAVASADGQIVVFTDATTHIKPDAVKAMVENLADPEVGCVAGLLIYQGRDESLTAAGGLSYWSYEIGLRAAESRLGTLIGVSGCLYAVRRSAYRPIAPNLISDFVIAMRMREQGLRTVLESRALCFEETLDRPERELSMRVRVAVRSINALVSEGRFLNPLVDPLYAWQLWSHKLLRYASPYCLLVTLVTSLMLAADPLYRAALLAQLIVLMAGLGGFLLQMNVRRMGLLSKPYYFLLTNVASVIATVRFAKGERMVTWNPIR